MSFALSALALRAIGGRAPHATGAAARPGDTAEPAHASHIRDAAPSAVSRPGPTRAASAPGPARAISPPGSARAASSRVAEVFAGWRFILADRALRALFLNQVLVGALIMATAPLMAVLMLGELGFSPFEYAVAFGLPCVGGLLGSRLARRIERRHALLVAGTLRACCSLPLAFVMPGAVGLALVLATQFVLVTFMGVFNPHYATMRLQLTRDDRVARVLAAWTVTSNLTIAAFTALWGVLAALVSLRFAIGAAGALLLMTPLLLLRLRDPSDADRHCPRASAGRGRSIGRSLSSR